MDSPDISCIEGIANAVFSSEEDVRMNVVGPFFCLLGYDNNLRSTETPVRGSYGSTKFPTTNPDVVYFNDTSWCEHLGPSEEDRVWVQDHALLLVEVKKPSKKEEPYLQPEYYAQWLRVPFIVSTNGNDLVIRRYNGYCSFKEILRVKKEDFISRWGEIERLISKIRVEDFVRSIGLKINNASRLDYDNYLISYRIELSKELRFPISRSLAVIQENDRYNLASRVNCPDTIAIPMKKLLKSNVPIIILGEPGSGKTFLLRQIMKRIIETNSESDIWTIPILIECKFWGRSFKSIIDAIFRELKPFLVGITPRIVEDEIAQKRYILLVDGIDEIKYDKESFEYEVKQLARNNNIKLILTSRHANYHYQFPSYFQLYQLCQLTDKQITNFAKKSNKLDHFSEYLRKMNLLELSRLPLYLNMLCNITIDTDSDIPGNKAMIQESFASSLLKNIPKKRNPSFQPQFSLKEKIDFLSKFAYSWFFDPSFDDYSACCEGIPHTNRSELISEITESGILSGDISHIEFLHQTILEFFCAKYVSCLGWDDLKRFIDHECRNESSYEILLFLVGLLKDKEQMAKVLDLLEEKNLILYIQCLKTKYVPPLPLSNYNEYEKLYLDELQDDYNRLINLYFYKSKRFFYPFGDICESDGEDESSYIAQVIGNLDIPNLCLSYTYLPARNTIAKLGSIAMDISSSSPSAKLYDHNAIFFYQVKLNGVGLGINSARDIAWIDVQSRLEELVNNHALSLPLPLCCEILVANLRHIASMARMFDDKSLEYIWDFESGVFDASEYFEAFRTISLKEHPYLVSREQSPYSIRNLSMNTILDGLQCLIEMSISMPENVLPDTHIGESDGFYSGIYTAQDAKSRLERIFSMLPGLYIELINKNFPKLREYLWHARIYPFKYEVRFSYGISPKRLGPILGQLGETFIYCIPIGDGGSMKAHVEQTGAVSDFSSEYDSLHSNYINILKSLGRYSRELSYFQVSSPPLDIIADEFILTDRIFNLLKSDLRELFR